MVTLALLSKTVHAATLCPAFFSMIKNQLLQDFEEAEGGDRAAANDTTEDRGRQQTAAGATASASVWAVAAAAIQQTMATGPKRSRGS